MVELLLWWVVDWWLL